MERLLIKKNTCICYFIADQQSAFFQTQNFTHILNQVQQNQEQMVLKEKNTPQGLKLLLRIHMADSMQTVKEWLEKLLLPKAASNS
jgi:transcription-repair coupling factor (superfamily II helicase)